MKTDYDETLAHAAVRNGKVKCVETLAAQERCDFWNVPNSDGDTPLMMALKKNKIDVVEILLRCPRVNLSCREEVGWFLVRQSWRRSKLEEIARVAEMIIADSTFQDIEAGELGVVAREKIRQRMENGQGWDYSMILISILRNIVREQASKADLEGRFLEFFPIPRYR